MCEKELEDVSFGTKGLLVPEPKLELMLPYTDSSLRPRFWVLNEPLVSPIELCCIGGLKSFSVT